MNGTHLDGRVDGSKIINLTEYFWNIQSLYLKPQQNKQLKFRKKIKKKENNHGKN